jgi:PhnB protein
MSDTIEVPAPVEVKGGVVAYLNVDGAIAAAEFYVKAFGGSIAAQIPPDEKGRSMHVHAYICGSSLMLSDFYPEHGHAKVAPQGFSLMLPVDRDIEARFQRAVDAGCTIVTPVQKMFWGDLYGELKDPWGVSWAMNQQA